MGEDVLLDVEVSVALRCVRVGHEVEDGRGGSCKVRARLRRSEVKQGLAFVARKGVDEDESLHIRVGRSGVGDDSAAV